MSQHLNRKIFRYKCLQAASKIFSLSIRWKSLTNRQLFFWKLFNYESKNISNFSDAIICYHFLSLFLYYPDLLLIPVFFNLGSAKPTGSENSLQASMRILKLAPFLVSKFRQKFNNVSKVPRLEKGWKALPFFK